MMEPKLSPAQLRQKIVHCDRAIQRFALRAELCDLPQWETFRQYVLEEFGEVERKLLTERNDEYMQGWLQGAYAQLQLFAFSREDCLQRIRGFEQDIADATHELEKLKKRNFRQPPPGQQSQ